MPTNMAFRLRRKGCAIPLIDVLTAAFATVHSCTLVHHDRHYELIREALPACSLKTLVMPSFGEPCRTSDKPTRLGSLRVGQSFCFSGEGLANGVRKLDLM